MASLNSTVDGMGFEEVNQPVTGTHLVYATHISGVTVEALEISGANVYATTNVVGDRVWGDEFVSGLLIKGTTGSITNIGGVATGSMGIGYINNSWLASSTGSIGFYGTTPIGKPDTEVNIGSLVTQLVALGLVGSIA